MMIKQLKFNYIISAQEHQGIKKRKYTVTKTSGQQNFAKFLSFMNGFRAPENEKNSIIMLKFFHDKYEECCDKAYNDIKSIYCKDLNMYKVVDWDKTVHRVFKTMIIKHRESNLGLHWNTLQGI